MSSCMPRSSLGTQKSEGEFPCLWRVHHMASSPTQVPRAPRRAPPKSKPLGLRVLKKKPAGLQLGADPGATSMYAI